jgi:antitoxin VapB
MPVCVPGLMVYIMVYTMSKTAKIFKNGRSQAVRLPAEFRFPQGTDEVSIRRDEATGEVVLSLKERAHSWGDFFERVRAAGPLPDILTPADRMDGPLRPDPFDGWEE